MKKFLLVFPLALACSVGQALVLTTPFDVGLNLASGSSLNGDSFTRKAPTLIAPGASVLTGIADQVNGYYTGVSAPPTVTVGGAISGGVSVRKQDAWLPVQSSGRFFVGSLFQIDYNAPDDPNLRWLVTYSFQSQGSLESSGGLLTSGFQNEQPFFFRESDDPSARNNDSYSLDTGVASFTAPGTYDWNVYATLATVGRDASGAVTRVVIHDGVRLSGTAVLVDPVPEPATLAVLGLGFVGLARRRRRR